MPAPGCAPSPWPPCRCCSLALLGGIVLRADRIELLGFVVQQPVLTGLFLVNIGILVYRIVAAIDAWNVARFLNDVDASGTGRAGRSKLPISPLSIAGLLAVVLVMAGGHIAVAHYNLLAMDLVNCVFSRHRGPELYIGGQRPRSQRSREPGRLGHGGRVPVAEPRTDRLARRRPVADRERRDRARRRRRCRPGTARSA